MSVTTGQSATTLAEPGSALRASESARVPADAASHDLQQPLRSIQAFGAYRFSIGSQLVN